MNKIKISLTKQDLDKLIEIPQSPQSQSNKLINVTLKGDKELTELNKSNLKSSELDNNSDEIKEIVNNCIIHVVSALLRSINKTYNLDINELKDRYMNEFNNNGKFTLLINKLLLLDDNQHLNFMDLSNSKKNNNGNIDYTKCFGKTATGSQCTRKRKGNSNFCGGHIHNQPHGRIDINDENEKVEINQEPITNETEVLIKQVKKRGRPKRVKDEEDKYALYQINDENYIISLETNKFYEYPKNSSTFDIKTAIPIGEKVDDENIFY